MNGPIDPNPDSCASTSPSTLSSSKGRREEPDDLKLVETLIDKIIKRLEENSFEPKVQDALKAIQLKQKLSEAKSGGLVKTSEAEKTFWQTIDEIRTSELESRTENIQAQILRTIVRLKYEAKNGVLPVKTITDTYNQGKSKEYQFTYQRIGRLLSAMGFQKARAGNNSAILWNEEKIDRMLDTFSPSPHGGCVAM
jgi:phenylalanyl-tRNA synthetase alpha subunit